MEQNIFDRGTANEIFDLILIECEATFEPEDLDTNDPDNKFWIDSGKDLMRLCLEFFVINRNNGKAFDYYDFVSTIMTFDYMVKCLDDKQYPIELRRELHELFRTFHGFKAIKVFNESDENFLSAKQQFMYRMMHFIRPMDSIHNSIIRG